MTSNAARGSYASLAAGLSALLGVIVSIGWALDVPVLRSAIPGAVEMKANTALGLLLVSATLFALVGNPGPGRRRLAAACAAAVALLGLATLGEYALGRGFGIDEWLVRDTGAAFNQIKGRMSPYSALSFLLLGGAAFGLTRPGRVLNGVVRAAAGLAAAIGIVSMVGYLWGASEIVTDRIAPPVALNTALAFFLLGSAVFLLARPLGPAAGSANRLETLVLRGFVPTALLVIVGGGLIYESGANFAASSTRIAHTQGVRAEIGHLYAAVADADLDMRNYVLVADPAFLQSFRDSAEQARRQAADIGTLVADNPAQLQRLRELSAQMEGRLQALEALGRERSANGPARAIEALAADARGSQMASIRTLSDRMDEAEVTLLGTRLQHTDKQRLTTLVTLLITLAVLTGLFLLLFRSIQREIQARNSAQAQLQGLNAGLEQRVAERTEELGFQQAFLRRVIDLQRSFVYAKDRSGRFVLANQSLADAMGTTVDELVDRREIEIAAKPQEAEAYHAADVAVIDGGREIVIPEETITLADGSVRWLTTVKRPIASAEGTTIVLGVSTDITEQKAAAAEIRLLAVDLERRVAERTADLRESNQQLEQARRDSEEASRAKSAFLANMSHEIRTPMNAIIGLTHLLSNEAADTRQRERLGKVGEAAQHLLQVINDILDMSKIEAGKLTLHDAEFSLDDVLSGATAMVMERAREKGLELMIDTDSMPARLVGDAVRLSQILINLLSNAVKFTEHGWVRLRAETLETRGRRVHARFEVQDTGPGISAERQAALFTAFEQADNSLSRQHGGTGLGLALSRQLARAMGGEAGVTSAPGAGSTFWFSAWLEQGGEEADAPAATGFKGLRALVVDDLPEALVVIGATLEGLGLIVDPVDSGAAALARVQAERAAGRRYDLLVIDWRMEPLDGTATLTRLRELLGEGEVPPSILVTAHDDAMLARQAMAAHFDAVVLKPVTGSALHDPLARLLRGAARRSARPNRQRDAGARCRALHAGQRVLLAEDNEVNLEVAQELLGAAGLRVDTAHNGARAVEMALETPYDLILMDMQMPVMDGLEATRTIRARSAWKTPVIAMTANAFVEDREACLAAGMDDHVTKPVDPATLYGALLRWLPARTPEAGQAADAPAGAESVAGALGSTRSAAEPADEAHFLQQLRAVGGLDVPAALHYVAGQAAVLIRVLRKFVETYRQGVPDLLDAGGSDAEMQERWRRCCHSIRSALTAVGASALLRELDFMESSLVDAGRPGGLVDRDDLRAMGLHINDDLQALVRTIEARLAPTPARDR